VPSTCLIELLLVEEADGLSVSNFLMTREGLGLLICLRGRTGEVGNFLALELEAAADVAADVAADAERLFEGDC